LFWIRAHKRDTPYSRLTQKLSDFPGFSVGRFAIAGPRNYFWQFDL
jgi:hypothetical protein